MRLNVQKDILLENLCKMHGLKGYSIGDAEVSIKHSGFVVNKGSATAKDVCSLLTHIKKVVLEKFGVQLEEEIIIMGDE